MLDPRYVADNLDEVRTKLLRRSPAAAESLSAIAELSGARRKLVAETEVKQAARNAANQDMAKLAKSPDKAAFAARRARASRKTFVWTRCSRKESVVADRSRLSSKTRWHPASMRHRPR